MSPDSIAKYGRHTWIRSPSSNIHINNDGITLCGQTLNAPMVIEFKNFNEKQVCHNCLHVVDPDVPKMPTQVRQDKTIYNLLGNDKMVRTLTKLQDNIYTYTELREFVNRDGSMIAYVIKSLSNNGLIEHVDEGYKLTYKGKLMIKVKMLIDNINNLTLKEMENYKQNIHTLVMYGEDSPYWRTMIRKVMEENEKNE